MKVSKCWIILANTACLITPLNLSWKRISFFKCSLQSAVSQWKIREKERQEKVGWQVPAPLVSIPAHSQDGHIVSKQIEWLALWQASLCGVQIHRVSTTVLLHSQVTACSSQQGASCLLNCWMATLSLVFWLWLGKNKTRCIDYFVLSFWTSTSYALSNSLSYIVTNLFGLRLSLIYTILKNGHFTTDLRVLLNRSVSFCSVTAHTHRNTLVFYR